MERLAYRVRGLAALGYSQAEVAGELGVSVRTVCRRARVGGVRFPMGAPPDVRKRAELLDLIGRGLTVTATARQLGKTPQTVVDTLRRLRSCGLVEHVGRGRWRVTAAWSG
jgi:DNA-binding CsgD family transcriptional regulator